MSKTSWLCVVALAVCCCVYECTHTLTKLLKPREQSSVTEVTSVSVRQISYLLNSVPLSTFFCITLNLKHLQMPGQCLLVYSVLLYSMGRSSYSECTRAFVCHFMFSNMGVAGSILGELLPPLSPPKIIDNYSIF